MNFPEFIYIPAGLEPEITALKLNEVCDHYLTHVQNFHMDGYLGAAYLNRMAGDNDLQANPKAQACFRHLVGKLAELRPFLPVVLHLQDQLASTPITKAKLALATKFTPGQRELDHAMQLCSRGFLRDARSELLKSLSKNRSCMTIIDQLLEVDLKNGDNPLEWSRLVELPELLADEWQGMLIQHQVRAGRMGSAYRLWAELAPRATEQTAEVLKTAAAASLAHGDNQSALELLNLALEKDPISQPTRDMISALKTPFTLQKNILNEANLTIGIYSYNKENLLRQTLDSLAQTEIGKARIIILLNGCTDNSQAVAQAAPAMFPNNEVKIISIPINMGAPAARNYIIHETLQDESCEALAFLDDDIALPVDWLQSLLTALDGTTEYGLPIGAVGCRICDPVEGENTPQELQFLYRDVSIAMEGLFRLSMAVPIWSVDTGLYSFQRDTDVVMGCCHLIRRACLEKVPEFDIRFSPSQVDDVAYHVDLRLAGYGVRYLGELKCVHHRASGGNPDLNHIGNVQGNDVKFYYRYANHLPALKSWQTKRNAKIKF